MSRPTPAVNGWPQISANVTPALHMSMACVTHVSIDTHSGDSFYWVGKTHEKRPKKENKNMHYRASEALKKKQKEAGIECPGHLKRESCGGNEKQAV